MMLFVEQPFVDYNRRIAIGLLRAPHVGREWTLTISRPPASVKEMTELLDRAEPDGVAVLDLSEDCLKLILARGIPCVSLSVDKFPSCGLPVVQTDDIAIGTLAADHFLQRGFRHFASAGSPLRVQFQARVKGLCRQAQEAQSPVHRVLARGLRLEPAFRFQGASSRNSRLAGSASETLRHLLRQ